MPSLSHSSLSHSLKEWKVATDALEQGQTILLLRKGGIREAGGKFTVPYRQVLLYPTYEHQQPNLLKPPYSDQVKPVTSGWHPDTLSIRVWAEITDRLELRTEAEMVALMDFHIWSQAFVWERLKWKPSQPIDALLLRTYRLGQPHPLPYHDRYGGCRSWIELDESISLEGSNPVLSQHQYDNQVAQIRAALSCKDL